MRARDVALAAALGSAERALSLQEALGDLLDASALDPRERALASEIALGSLRRRLQLDLALSCVVSRPVGKLQPALAEALRQGAYQILFLDRVPARAAVNETVELVKARMGGKPASFANACLRALSRTIRKKSAPSDRIDDPRCALAGRDGLFVLLARKLLPDPDRDEAGWLAGAYGYPRWMVERWLARHGRARAERILEWGNTPPPLCVRLNQSNRDERDQRDERDEQDTRPDLSRVFRSCRSFRPGDVPGTYLVEAEVAPGELPGFAEGLFTIQDETQARPVRVLAPAKGARVLDLCAGKGGKSVQLAEAVGPAGRVVAVDTDARRLGKAGEAARRLGLDNIEFVEGDALPHATRHLPQRSQRSQRSQRAGFAAGEFDYVLVDVPCSNLGALDRRPEVRFRASVASIAALAEKEAALLTAALARLAPGGALVYSACSFEEEETLSVVRGVLEATPGNLPEGAWRHTAAPGFRLESEHWVLPEPARRDGGYCARIVRDRE